MATKIETIVVVATVVLLSVSLFVGLVEARGGTFVIGPDCGKARYKKDKLNVFFLPTIRC